MRISSTGPLFEDEVVVVVVLCVTVEFDGEIKESSTCSTFFDVVGQPILLCFAAATQTCFGLPRVDSRTQDGGAQIHGVQRHDLSRNTCAASVSCEAEDLVSRRALIA